METLKCGLRSSRSGDIDIAFEDLILIDLSPTEISLLTIIEKGIDTVEDLSKVLGLSK